MSGDYGPLWGQLMNNLDKAETALPDMDDDDLIELRDTLDSLVDAIDAERSRR